MWVIEHNGQSTISRQIGISRIRQKRIETPQQKIVIELASQLFP